MSEKEEPFNEGFQAAGYCGANHPRLQACCTRPPGHDGDHVDHYTGRKSVTDVEGHRWRQ